MFYQILCVKSISMDLKGFQNDPDGGFYIVLSKR